MVRRRPASQCVCSFRGDPLQGTLCPEEISEYKSEVERIQKRMSTLERMLENHEVRARVYQVCEGGLTLIDRLAHLILAERPMQNGQGWPTAVTKITREILGSEDPLPQRSCFSQFSNAKTTQRIVLLSCNIHGTPLLWLTLGIKT